MTSAARRIGQASLRVGVIGAPVLQGTPLAALVPITAHGRFETEGRDLAPPGP